MGSTVNDIQMSDEAAEHSFENAPVIVFDFNGDPIYQGETFYSYGKDNFTKETADDYMEHLIENHAKDTLKDLLENHGALETLEDLGAEEIKGEQNDDRY
ncbi:hypothetical protein LABALGLTS371_15870 [Dellaglioa algida]|uniref:Uncharacterized protein n=1 Tax=Dellaglioa algida TaxID=105612 RepID=A0A5C6M6B6_9LACO|nr:hypothetical protein [Dellaglioa algida]MDK1716380.1 hypothetical protein [Dellaglioa algida]MDK1720266.1 hypothetical protein [Dellaglioa algida]MDK1721321.1 hypothetical protein [Dellaglioa algida]TWW10178.1 hypothetical protein LABALGLTS371_15870 [Dellaglioa algida]